MAKSYTIRQGDTVHLIAQRELGDTGRWVEIVIENQMSYPFIGETKSSGVFTLGETIQLPFIEEREEFNIHGNLRDSDILLSYNKRDLSYGNAGEFEDDGYGDIKTISGMDCLLQDLTNRLATPLGTLPYHPDYGSEIQQVIGNKMDMDWVEKAKVEILRTLLSDDRVVDVIDIEMKADRGVVRIDYTVVTVNGLKRTQVAL